LQIALKKLDELINSRLLEAGQVRRFYFALSDIFREFIEREIKIQALEETLEELKPTLKSCKDLQTEEIRQACWFLDLSEMAKFAQFVPPSEEIAESVRILRLWMSQVAQRHEMESKKKFEEQKVAS